jgi:hypothetical protein
MPWVERSTQGTDRAGSADGFRVKLRQKKMVSDCRLDGREADP